MSKNFNDACKFSNVVECYPVWNPPNSLRTPEFEVSFSRKHSHLIYYSHKTYCKVCSGKRLLIFVSTCPDTFVYWSLIRWLSYVRFVVFLDVLSSNPPTTAVIGSCSLVPCLVARAEAALWWAILAEASSWRRPHISSHSCYEVVLPLLAPRWHTAFLFHSSSWNHYIACALWTDCTLCYFTAGFKPHSNPIIMRYCPVFVAFARYLQTH